MNYLYSSHFFSFYSFLSLWILGFLSSDVFFNCSNLSQVAEKDDCISSGYTIPQPEDQIGVE